MIIYDFDVLEKLLKQNDINFLKKLPDKRKKISNYIQLTNSKKDELIKIFNQQNNTLNQKSDNLKDFLINFNTSFDSIENIIQNLNNLQNKYSIIEKYTLIIVKVSKFSINKKYLENYIYTLITKINLTKTYEKEINSTNQKSMLLINNFLNKHNKEISTPTSAYNSIENIQDNLVLKISEKEKCVELPYTKEDIEKFLTTYPNIYNDAKDVISKEYKMHISLYNNHPSLARFREAYYLCRNKELKSVIESFIFAKNMMFRREINPTIIAAVRSVKQLEDYIQCLKYNKLNEFKYFKIIFEVNPV